MDEQTNIPEPAESAKQDKIDTVEKFEVWKRRFSDNSQERLYKAVSNYPAIDHIVRSQAKEGFWLQREVARLMYEFGQVYHPLPKAVLDILARYDAMPSAYHFLHLSSTDPTKVAYTESWEHGVADRQQQISLGKYIKKYHPHVPEFAIKQCQEFLNNLLVTAEVKFTTDFATMFAIYQQAAPACMSKSTAVYGTNGRHPIEVYANHELIKLAYLEPRPGTYTARSLVVDEPGNKRYVRAYGDALLPAQLDRLGYRRGSLLGVKLPRIEFEHGGQEYILCPYLDDHEKGVQGTGSDQFVKLFDDHLLVVNNRTLGRIATSSEGRISRPAWAPVFVSGVPESCQAQRDDRTGHDEWLDPSLPGLTLGVLSSFGEDRVYGFFQFRNYQDVVRHTEPLVGGGRWMTNAHAATSWSIMALIDKDGNHEGYVSARRTRGYVSLSSTYYPRMTFRAMRFNKVARAEDAVSSVDGTILKFDSRKMTAGRYTGAIAHVNDVVVDYKDPTILAHNDDCVYARTKSGEHRVAKTLCVYSEMLDAWFDKRDYPDITPTGQIPGKEFVHAGAQLFDWNRGSLGAFIRPYDHYALMNRETNFGVLLDIDVCQECTADDMLKLAHKIVIKNLIDGTTEFLYSDQRSKEDAQIIYQHLNKPLAHWFSLQFVCAASGEKITDATFKTRLRSALMESIVKDLDIVVDDAETLIPQPETIAEPAPRVEPVESES